MTSNINNYKFLSCLGKLFAHLVISPAPTKTTIYPDCAVCFIIFGRFVNLSKDWELPDGVPIILFPSRIAPFKGHITLLKALSILKKDPKNKFFCIMAGSIKQNSNFIDELKSFIEEYKLENYVKFEMWLGAIKSPKQLKMYTYFVVEITVCNNK